MSKPIGNCLLYKSFTSIRIHLKVFAQEDLIFLPFPLVSRSLWGQNGHLPAPRTSSMSTKPSNSFWQFKVSVTIRYRSCLRRGFLSNLLPYLWRTFMSIISISRCPPSPVHLSPYYHLRFEPFPFYSGSFAANDYLLSLIHFALNFDLSRNIAPLCLPLL